MLKSISYFARSENILVAMLNDQDQHVKRKTAKIVLSLKGNPDAITNE